MATARKTLLSLPFLCAVPLLAAPLPGQVLTARVNDARSHGQVADGLLSLDEAIRLANGTLALAQLSAAERAQVTGIGSVVATVVVDAAVTPVITYEAELTPLVGLAHAHVDYHIEGVAGPAGRPVLDARGFSAAVPIRTVHAHVKRFSLRGGRVGITADTTGHFHPGHKIKLAHLDLEGQTEAGFRFTAPSSPAGANTPVAVEDVVMRGLPVGYDLLDHAVNGTLTCTSEFVRMRDVKLGVRHRVTARGGYGDLEFFRSEMIGAEACVELVRDPASDSEVLLRFVHGTYTASTHVLHVTGSDPGNTVVHFHHVHFRGGTGPQDQAFQVGPATGRFDLHGSDNLIEGNVTILAGRPSRRIWLHNNTFRGGSLFLDNEGVPPNVLWNLFESFPVVAAATNRTPVVFDSCHFYRSPIEGRSAIGSVSLRNCYTASSPTTGSVSNSSPAPSPWLGHTAVLPSDPPVGGHVDLVLDLPRDMGALWLLGLSDPRPVTTNEPYRFYFRLDTFFALPGLYVLQDRFRLHLPPDPALAGFALYAQAITLPLQGQTHVPAASLPPGGLIRIRPR